MGVGKSYGSRVVINCRDQSGLLTVFIASNGQSEELILFRIARFFVESYLLNSADRGRQCCQFRRCVVHGFHLLSVT